MSASITIEAVPVELLDIIFQLAKTGRKDPVKEYKYPADIMDYRGDPNEVNPNEDFPLYKSLRLVCKRWKAISTPLLFDTVVLLSHAMVSPIHEFMPFAQIHSKHFMLVGSIHNPIHSYYRPIY